MLPVVLVLALNELGFDEPKNEIRSI